MIRGTRRPGGAGRSTGRKGGGGRRGGNGGGGGKKPWWSCGLIVIGSGLMISSGVAGLALAVAR